MNSFLKKPKLYKILFLSALLLVLMFAGKYFVPNTLFGVEKHDDFIGFKQEKFEFEGYEAIVVIPENPHPGKHWIWRARFWGVEPQVELALLEKGFHLVHIDTRSLYGNEEAVRVWNRFYEHLILNYGLNPKVVLQGMSRGGIYVYNWAASNPEKIASIYADAPVLDIKSWPGGFGSGEGDKKEWPLYMAAYGITEENISSFRGSPIFKAGPIAKAKIPIIHVCGDEDMVVPMAENTFLLIDSLRHYGHDMKLILKKGVGHHPHSLVDPREIVAFIMDNL